MRPCPRPLDPAALLAATLLAAALLAPRPAAQRDYSGVQIKTTPVAGKLSMLEGAGGNIGVSAGADGILIVDDQFAPLSDRIRTALDALGTGGPRYILNTHFHGDHTGGNAVFGKDGTIVAHENVRTRLLSPRDVGGQHEDPAPPEALPVITFRQSVSLHWNGEEVRVIHLPPGHTDGDSIVWFTGSNVVHLGDHFFNGRFPFIDLDGGGDVLGYMRNVDMLVTRLPADAKLIPGHGPLGTMDDLKAFEHMLQATIGVVQGGLKAGRTLEQIQADGLPAEWKTWEWEFIDTKRWLQLVHDGLKRSPNGPMTAETPDFGPPPAAAPAQPAGR